MNKTDEERIGGEHQEKQLEDFSLFAAGEQDGKQVLQSSRAQHLRGRRTCGRLCRFVDL